MTVIDLDNICGNCKREDGMADKCTGCLRMGIIELVNAGELTDLHEEVI